MNKVSITLELTPSEVIKVMELLSTSPESKLKPTEHKPSVQVYLPTLDLSSSSKQSIGKFPDNVATKPVTKKSVKGVKLPSFGRTQEQIDSYDEEESKRLEAMTAEEADKEARALERAEKKAIKDKEQAEKDAAKKKLQDEVESIKAIKPLAAEASLAKPWEV